MKKLFLLLFLSACGAPSSDEPRAPVPAPVPVPPINKETPTFAGDIQPLMQKYCAQCHNDDTFISQQDVFLTSKAPARIANKSMPLKSGKNYASWGDAQRAIVAKFVSLNQ